MQKIESFESLVAHLKEVDGSYAKSSLEAYFYKHAYTGSSFENFCGKDHNKFTADDIVAVSMLSVKIPPSASRWILGDGQKCLTKLLKELNPKLTIQDPKADLTIGKTAWNLWKEIHSLRGVGETMASKLLAAKRPLLFPIFDQHVARALKLTPDCYWEPWQKFMRSKNGIYAEEIVREMARDLGKSELSTLRLLDIVVWMYEHGHKAITQKLIDEEKMICVNYADPN